MTDEIPDRTDESDVFTYDDIAPAHMLSKYGVGAHTPYKTTNAAGFYLLLFALFILTFILNANVLLRRF